VLVEPGIYRTPIFDRLVTPADGERLGNYGKAAAYADDVLGTFNAAISAPDAPGPDEVTEAFVRLVEMAYSEPFGTVVSAPIRQLLEPYNAAAEQLRPIIAQIFNVPTLAAVQPTAPARE
jgi:hypothetical protein